MRRRDLLAGAGTSIAAVCGCLGDSTVRPPRAEHGTAANTTRVEWPSASAAAAPADRVIIVGTGDVSRPDAPPIVITEPRLQGIGTLVALDPDEGTTVWRIPDVVLAGEPVHRGDTLYLPCETATNGGEWGTNVGLVIACDPTTGAIRWTVRHETAGYREIAVDDDRVYAATAAGHLHCLDAASGRVRWNVEHVLGDQNGSQRIPDLVAHGIVVAVVGRGRSVGVDGRTGARHWTYDHIGRGFGGRGVYGSTVVVADGERVHGIDLTSGARRWLEPLTMGPSSTISVRARGLVTAGNHAYVIDRQTGISAFEITSGTYAWRATPGTIQLTHVAIADDVLYAAGYETLPGIGARAAVSAVDRATGAVRWTNRTIEDRRVTGLVGRDDRVLLACRRCAGERLVLLDGADGQPVATPVHLGEPHLVAGDSSGDAAYVTTAYRRSVTAFDLSTGDRRWTADGFDQPAHHPPVDVTTVGIDPAW